MNGKNIIEQALQSEAKALVDASKKIGDQTLEKLQELFSELIETKGPLFFCGVGKSGLVGQKLASTFSSLGLPSFFLHPVEALHGDLGQVTPGSAVVLISKSGTTEEIVKLLPYLDIPAHKRIGLIGNPDSPLVKEMGIFFDCSVDQEICINNQAPTTSTTLAMAMGDGLAVFYEHLVGLTKEGFANNHPGGLLGKSLRLRVKDVMVRACQCPVVTKEATLKEVLLKLTENPVGMCAVVQSESGHLEGVIVDGDIRRILTKDSSEEVLSFKAMDVMNSNPVKVTELDRAYDALKLMEERERQISTLPVVNDGHFKGILRLHDLVREGLL